MKKVAFIAVLLLPNMSSWAQNADNTFSLSGQIRPRFEVRAGTFQPLPDSAQPAILVSQRTRLVFHYEYKDVLSFQVSPQSVSIWGQSNIVQGVEKSGSQFSLFEAWAKLKLAKSWDLQIGRQVISLDDERIMGGLDWAQGARAHDALSLNFKKEAISLKAFGAYNQNYRELYGNNISNVSGALFSPTDAAPYKTMQGLWAQLPLYQGGNISLLASNFGFQNAKHSKDTAANYFMQTLGFHYTHKKDKLSAALSSYVQTGKNALGQKTAAYLLAGNIGYHVQQNWQLVLGADFLSGNEVPTNSATNHAFQPSLGTNHKFYGSMDYYYAGNGHKNAGLLDLYLKSNFQASEKFSFLAAVHQFLAPSTLQNNGMDMDKNLGQEIDLDFKYQVNTFCSFVGGYSVYLNTPTTNYLKNVVQSNKAQHWLWLSLNIAPKLFSSKF